MKLLVVAATRLELSQLQVNKEANKPLVAPDITQLIYAGHQVDVLITGVGAPATIFELTRTLLANQYDLVIQAGIGGAYNKDLNLGDVVAIHSDRFAQAGVEDDQTFIDVFELGLVDENKSPYSNGWLRPVVHPLIAQLGLKSCRAVTVETALGNEKSIALMRTKYAPEVESMEGAAFFYVCLQLQIPCIQLRAISNYVEKRNKANWNIPFAVEQLNEKLLSLINLITK